MISKQKCRTASALKAIAIFLPLASSTAFAGDCVVPPSGLIHWWRGEDNAQDHVGFSHGSPTLGAGFTAGEVGRGFSFNGTSGAVNINDSPSWNFGKSDFTIDLWVRFGAIIPRAPFISSDDLQRKWIFWYDELGHGALPGPALRFHISAPGMASKDPISASWRPITGAWYHVAVTRATNNYSLYINGARVAGATSSETVPDASAALQIGAAEAFHFNGALDEIDIFDRALSSSEVRAIFASRISGKCPGVGGQVKGISPLIRRIVCRNRTTGQSVEITLPKTGKSWDCVAAGLKVRSGEMIDMSMGLRGIAE